MPLTDDEILAQAKAIDRPKYIVAISGKARDIALILSEEINGAVKPSGVFGLLETPLISEFVEHHTIDAEENPEEWAQRAIAVFNKTLREGEPARTLVRVLEIGPSSAHVFTRMPAGGADGELFKCSGCGLVVSGRPTFNQIGSPYALTPPRERDADQRRRFYSYCGN